MTESSENSRKLAGNRKAFHDYEVLERIEAGIVLVGTEVKSVRTGQVGLAGAFGRLESGSIFLHGVNIPPYEQGNRFNHDPVRPRRLLLHRREAEKLRSATEEKGLSVVPLSIYLKRGWVKVELGVCRGKTHGDKRETLRRKMTDREAARAVSAARRRGKRET
jgi:SsrA-binding protein